MVQQRLAAFVTIAALATCPVAAASDLIITNAKVFTADPRQPYAQAVAITGTRISFVGSAARVKALAGSGTRIIDAGGRLLTPGLIEAHVHAGAGAGGQVIELPNAMWPGPAPEQVIAAVRAAVPTGTGWLTGTIGPATTDEERDWRRELDQVSPERPVRLRAWWGHGTILNSAALRLLGISDKAPDPIGGWYGRRADGRLNGLVREQAEVIVAQKLAENLPVETGAADIRQASERYARWGVTSVHQMAHNYRLNGAVAALAAAKPDIKWTVYGWGWPQRTASDAWSEFAAARQLPPRVRIGGIKWILDSTPVERDAFMRSDYADRPGHRGRSNYSDAELLEILQQGLAKPQQLALHVVGDGEVRRLFTAMERIAPASRWRTERVRIEHGDGLTPDLLPQAKRLGVTVVQNPLHVVADKDQTGRPWFLNRVGEARVDEFQLLGSLSRAGIPLALGSDAGEEAANPFLNMMFAVRYDRNPQEALSREQALHAYTAGAAFAEGLEKSKGRIAVGYRADLALLSQDVLTAPVEALPRTRSALTIVDGKIVYENLAF